MDQPTRETWWNRPAGGREVLAIAAPLIVSTLSWTAMQFTDRMFLSWVSGEAMAAAFTSGVAWFAALCLPLGVSAFTSTFVSQYHGDDQPEKIGPATWQGVWTAAIASPLILALIPLAPTIFSWADHSAELTALEVQYFQILCWGAPGFLAAQALESFFSGRSRTGVVMCVDLGAVATNIVLDGMWVLGWGTGVRWGLPGAAWATVIAFWVKFLAYLFLVLRPANRRTYATWSGLRWDAEQLRRLWRFGLPSGVQMLLDVGGFTAFVILVGQLGDVATVSTSLVFSVSHFAFMPVWGCGMACSVLVGQRLGECRAELAERSTYTTLVITWAYMAAISTLFVAAPNLFLGGFFSLEPKPGVSSTDVLLVARRLLWFVAAYNLFDATLIVFVSALKGAGDTRFIMRVSLAMMVLLAGSTWLAVRVAHTGVYQCWGIITAVVWIMAAVYAARFRHGAWKSMRVIELQHHSLPSAEAGSAGEAPSDEVLEELSSAAG